ncbi:riboflavin synthase [Demequina sp.]|uniref:riboflavin synthase n=1 Tax=Demequina sp. TaxID=2050685 RepID=UPI003A8AB07D
MFTGIVESVGTVTRVTESGSTAQLTIRADLEGDYVHGESIAVNGVCLTVASSEADEWTADVMRVTLETTALAGLAVGSRVNLERALRADARLGGHMMLGHVDGTARLVSADVQPEWTDLTFEIPQELERYVVRKGSIALNGTSLTVAALEGTLATVSLIPTTLTETTFGDLAPGDLVNVEVDVIGKYVEKMLGERA